MILNFSVSSVLVGLEATVTVGFIGLTTNLDSKLAYINEVDLPEPP